MGIEKKLTLWELSKSMTKLNYGLESIIEEEDLSEIEKEELIQETLTENLKIEEQFEEKVEDIAKLINYLKQMAKVRREESKRIGELAKRAELKINRLKGYLLYHCRRLGKTKIETATNSISLRKKSKALEIYAEERLTDDYKKIEVKIDKVKLKEAIKHGLIPEDVANIVEKDEYSLIIK